MRFRRVPWGGRTARLMAVAVCFCLAGAAVARAERLALIVGNGNYEVAPDLKNPVSDATAMAAALTDLGFTVTLMTDRAGTDLWAEMDRFIAAAASAESVVFYYSGHAFQMSGVNYLVPVSAKLQSRETIAEETWSLDAIIARLQSRSRQTLIFLDACRNDPLPAVVRGSGVASDGLARVQTGVGTFVAFSTEPGGVAVDAVGDAPNSPFTTAVLKHLGTPGMSISDMMIEVRNEVEVATLRKQVPWDQSSLREQFYFVPPEQAAKQELSEADYELLAQLSPEDRKTFLDLLADSGFDADSLAKAEAEIAVAEANLEMVAVQSVVVSAVVDPETPVVSEAPGADQTGVVSDIPVVSENVVVSEDVAISEHVAVSETGPEAEISPADLEVVEMTVTVSTLEPEPDPAGSEEPIRLAALDWDTRDIAINEVTIERLRLQGKVLQPDNDDDRAILAAIDPALLETEAATPVPTEDLARAVQTELKRVGCYQMGVDGDWGKGSRTALTSYYLAKKVIPTSLEPTAALHASLTQEKNVVCKVRVASSAVKTGVRAKVKAPEAAASKTNANRVTTGVNGRRPPETQKQKIKKSAIGMTGSF